MRDRQHHAVGGNGFFNQAGGPPQTGKMERGKIVVGKYRLNQPLGSGGMAEVWSATNTFTERQVAIKFMNPQVAKTPEAATRFLKEAKVSARVNHPNIIDILDVGQTEEQQLFLVMELLTGFPLEVALRRQNPPMTLYELTLVMVEVGEALAAAHKTGIVHRDLKPTNIFLHKVRDGVAIPKLLDFGVSKFLEDDSNHALTMAGTVLGSPLYMSPEQARGESNLDGRTDIFAFGAILFEAVCGYRPYEAKNFNALIVKIATSKPKQIDVCAPHVPDSLRRIVRSCMETDLKRRTQTFEEVIVMLRQAMPELERSAMRLPTPVIASTVIDPDATNALPVLRASDRPSPSAATPIVRTAATPFHDTIPGMPGPLLDAAVASAVAKSTAPRSAASSGPPPPNSNSGSSAASRSPGSIPPGAIPYPPHLQQSGTSQHPLAPPSGPSGSSWTPNTSYASVTVSTPRKRNPAWLIIGGAALVIGGIGIGAVVAARPRGGVEPTFSRAPDPTSASSPAVIELPTTPATGAVTTTAAEGASQPAGASGSGSTEPPSISVDALPRAAATTSTTTTKAAGPVPKGSGRLHVAASPGWCSITIDGKNHGATPIAEIDLPAGKHQVLCKPPTGKERTATVSVQDGATAKYRFALDD